jgi:hypothetical protein
MYGNHIVQLKIKRELHLMSIHYTKLRHAEDLLENYQFQEAFKILSHVEPQIYLSKDEYLYCMRLKKRIRGIWENFTKSQKEFESNFEMASSKGIINSVHNPLSFDESKKKKETPVVLFIMSSGGVPVFIKNFSNQWGIPHERFGSFLSAVNSWGAGVFAQSIDQLIFGVNIILMRSLDSFFICYVIKGISKFGQQKLNNFINTIQNQSEIWDALLQSKKSNMLLTADNTPDLDQLALEIFG